jgi:diaminopimelate epimerase
MNFTFYKYQGTGNDFIMIDNRTNSFPKNNKSIIAKLCDRHFGIGADGLILIENNNEVDFEMVYFNADGSQTFCGNGARCAVAFANQLQIISAEANFKAVDGHHFAKINKDVVSLNMSDVTNIEIKDTGVFLNTGTQHHVELVDNLDNYPVYKNGKAIRNSYKTPGSNVNFVQPINKDTFRVRTYEKGVEDETLACGTGVTAVAIAMHYTNKTKETTINLPVEGGKLAVNFKANNNHYTNVVLTGKSLFCI